MTPQELERFRQNTATQRMPGVTLYRFRCCDCHQSKGMKGRRRTTAGWRCADCVSRRENR